MLHHVKTPAPLIATAGRGSLRTLKESGPIVRFTHASWLAVPALAVPALILAACSSGAPIHTTPDVSPASSPPASSAPAMTANQARHVCNDVGAWLRGLTSPNADVPATLEQDSQKYGSSQLGKDVTRLADDATLNAGIQQNDVAAVQKDCGPQAGEAIFLPTAVLQAQCGTTVKSWLASVADDPSGSSIQHDIQAIEFDTHAAVETASSNPAAESNFLAGVNAEVSDLGNTEPPVCAASGENYFDQFSDNASLAGSDTAGTPQALSDAESALDSFSQFNTQLQQGAGVTVPDSDPKLAS